MKINISKEVRENTLVGHIILDGLSEAIKGNFNEAMEPYNTPEGYVMDVVLKAGNTEIDIEKFCKHWQSQVERMIREEAERIVGDKFSDITGLLSDLEERLKPEIEKRLKDWER